MPRLMVPGIFTDEQKEKMKKISFNLINVRAVGSGDVEYIAWMYDIISNKMTREAPKNAFVRAKINAFLEAVKEDYGKNKHASEEEKRLINEMTDRLREYVSDYGELEDIFSGKYQQIESNRVKDILYGFRGEENPDKNMKIENDQNSEIRDQNGNSIENTDEYFAEDEHRQQDSNLTIVEDDLFHLMNEGTDPNEQAQSERDIAINELKRERDKLRKSCETVRKIAEESSDILNREQWTIPGDNDFADPTEEEIEARIQRNRELRKNVTGAKKEPENEKCAEGLLKVLDQFNRITGYRYTRRPEIKALETMGGNVEKAVMKLEGFKIDEDEKTIGMQNAEMLEAFREVSEYNREMLELLNNFNEKTGIKINGSDDFEDIFRIAEKEQDEIKRKAEELRSREADAEKALDDRRRKLTECSRAEEETVAKIREIEESIRIGGSKKERLLKEINESTTRIADIKTKRIELVERYKKDAANISGKIQDIENRYGINELLEYEEIYRESEKIGKMIKECKNNSILFREKDLENIRTINRRLTEWDGKDFFRFDETTVGSEYSYLSFFKSFDEASTALYGSDGHATAKSRLNKMTKQALNNAEEEYRKRKEWDARKDMKDFFLPELVGLYDEMKARLTGKEHDINTYSELKAQYSRLRDENSDILTEYMEEQDEAEAAQRKSVFMQTSKLSSLEEDALKYAKELEQEKKLLDEKKKATGEAREEFDKVMGIKTEIIAKVRNFLEDNKSVSDRYFLVKETKDKYNRLCKKRDGVLDILKKAKKNNTRPKTECDTRFERITEKLKDFKDHINDGQGTHKNTAEFTAMADALEAFNDAAKRFMESNKEKLSKPGNAVKAADDREFLRALANLRKKTEDYITKKGSQFVIESWTSNLRHTRLNFARRLYVWTDNLNENLGKTLKTEFGNICQAMINNDEIMSVVEPNWNSVMKFQKNLPQITELFSKDMIQKGVNEEMKEKMPEKEAPVINNVKNGPVLK